MIIISVVDQPIQKSLYTKWFQTVLLLPEGKALLIEGLDLKEATNIRTQAWRFAKFQSRTEPNGEDGKFKLTLWRKE